MTIFSKGSCEVTTFCPPSCLLTGRNGRSKTSPETKTWLWTLAINWSWWRRVTLESVCGHCCSARYRGHADPASQAPLWSRVHWQPAETEAGPQPLGELYSSEPNLTFYLMLSLHRVSTVCLSPPCRPKWRNTYRTLTLQNYFISSSVPWSW